MTTNNELFQVNIQLMRVLNLWPAQNRAESQCWRTFKDLSAFLASMPAILPIIADFVIQMQGKYDDVLDITENLTALGALFGMLYLGACFVQNRTRIMALIERLKVFEEFGTVDEMLATEHRASLYTRMFIFYGIFGNLCYLAIPYANMAACRERRAASRYSAGIPCGLITRCRLPFDYEDSWFLYVAISLQLYACLVATMITLTTTMFLVALLMQVITQMQALRRLLKGNAPIRECLRYHNMINEYASHVTQAFSSMMLMHITLTSFEISVLGFEVLMVNSRTDSLRFGMHLVGWLVLLFLICSYGQKLIDESTGIGLDAYETNWYDSSVSVQKDLLLMILRSQKPLTLSAASLGVMSLETYLGVLSTAYSYFTLLLNMKKD
ncbi:Odorant receptor 85b [Carabus blaptoides fortunei]